MFLLNLNTCIRLTFFQVTGLRASTNNRASTVLLLFAEAIQKYGEPSRLRGDHGRENKGVALYMILSKGLNQASFIWGSRVIYFQDKVYWKFKIIIRSTHNTRIERLWVELGTQFVRRWRAFFYRLERLHGLDRKNLHHLWLLHDLFLNTINEDCEAFWEDWNSHPLLGEGHDQSPNVCTQLLYILTRKNCWCQ